MFVICCGFARRILDVFCFFFLKQKAAYEMRISDWSSYVCSSDLLEAGEFWVEIRNDGSSSAIKIDCSEMPRFQRCLAQADELAPVARLTIDQQRGRRIAHSYGVAAPITIVTGRFASSPTFP